MKAKMIGLLFERRVNLPPNSGPLHRLPDANGHTRAYGPGAHFSLRGRQSALSAAIVSTRIARIAGKQPAIVAAKQSEIAASPYIRGSRDIMRRVRGWRPYG
jgi:hypothetical protein